jgi:hypothetical protein
MVIYSGAASIFFYDILTELRTFKQNSSLMFNVVLLFNRLYISVRQHSLNSSQLQRQQERHDGIMDRVR